MGAGSAAGCWAIKADPIFFALLGGIVVMENVCGGLKALRERGKVKRMRNHTWIGRVKKVWTRSKKWLEMRIRKEGERTVSALGSEHETRTHRKGRSSFRVRRSARDPMFKAVATLSPKGKDGAVELQSITVSQFNALSHGKTYTPSMYFHVL